MTVDDRIGIIERHIGFLKSERKKLNREIIGNRQQIAEARNELKKLKAERRERK